MNNVTTLIILILIFIFGFIYGRLLNNFKYTYRNRHNISKSKYYCYIFIVFSVNILFFSLCIFLFIKGNL